MLGLQVYNLQIFRNDKSFAEIGFGVYHGLGLPILYRNGERDITVIARKNKNYGTGSARAHSQNLR